MMLSQMKNILWTVVRGLIYSGRNCKFASYFMDWFGKFEKTHHNTAYMKKRKKHSLRKAFFICKKQWFVMVTIFLCKKVCIQKLLRVFTPAAVSLLVAHFTKNKDKCTPFWLLLATLFVVVETNKVRKCLPTMHQPEMIEISKLHSLFSFALTPYCSHTRTCLPTV